MESLFLEVCKGHLDGVLREMDWGDYDSAVELEDLEGLFQHG